MEVKRANKLHCPLLDKACIQDDCQFWTSFTRQKSATEQEVVFNCAIAFLPILLTQNVLEQIGTQQAVQHQTNQHFATFRALQIGIPIPRMSGNLRRDGETLKQLGGGDGEAG